MSPAERKRAERDRHKAAGRVRRDVWLYPADWPAVRALVEKLNGARAAEAKPKDEKP